VTESRRPFPATSPYRRWLTLCAGQDAAGTGNVVGKTLIYREILRFWRKVGNREGYVGISIPGEFKVAIMKGLEHNVESLCRLGD
jgi:hypothetical protein